MMLRQALVAVGPRTVMTGVLVGGAALALGALFLPHAAAAPSAGPGMYRLVLHAPEKANEFYVSAWAEGDVFVPRADAKVLTFVRRGDEHDGCTWQGTETLTRLRANVYAYRYDERILACRPDARPFEITPRQGIVTAEKWNGPATPTAFNAMQAPGDLWNPPLAAFDDDEHCNDVADDDAAEADEDSADADDDAEQQMADARAEMADAQREIAEAQQQIADAIRQANEQVKAALANHDE
jgi:hypothetical protein